jgi:hypothetical protein
MSSPRMVRRRAMILAPRFYFSDDLLRHVSSVMPLENGIQSSHSIESTLGLRRGF